MLSIQIQTQNFTIIKTKNQINNLPSKIGMGMGMGMGVARGEREKGSCGEGERADAYGSTVERVDGWAQPHWRRRWAGLGSTRHVGARLGSARRRRRGCVCECERLCER